MAKKKVSKKAPVTERSSSFVASRVDREAAKGKGETRNTIIRSKVDDAASGAATPDVSARNPTRSARRSTTRAPKKKAVAKRARPTI